MSDQFNLWSVGSTSLFVLALFCFAWVTFKNFKARQDLKKVKGLENYKNYFQKKKYHDHLTAEQQEAIETYWSTRNRLMFFWFACILVFMCCLMALGMIHSLLP